MHFGPASTSTFALCLGLHCAFERNVNLFVMIHIDCNHHPLTSRWVRHGVSNCDTVNNPPRVEVELTLNTLEALRLRGVFCHYSCDYCALPRRQSRRSPRAQLCAS